MPKPNAQSEADRLLDTLLVRCAQLEAEHGKVEVIPISTYATDHDLATLRPEDGGKWTAAFHREVMEIIALRLRLAEYRVQLIPLDAAKYLRWLTETGQKNTPAQRAQFISFETVT